jgi:uncharacterized protein (DUF58 family)
MEGTISGQHLSPLHGMNVEFAGFREYCPGDDLRRLDWRVFARSNRYYIKEFQEESNLRATILMDASASMRYAGGGRLSKYDFGATAAACLAALLIRQQDAVGLVVFDNQQRTALRPAATQARLTEIIDTLESTTPNRTTELGDVVSEIGDQIKRRGVIVIISDLLTDLERLYDGLGKLQFKGHDVVMFHVLDPDELDLPFDGSVIFRDLESAEELFAEPRFFQRAYQEAMQSFRGEVMRRARAGGMDYLLLRSDHDLGLALSHYFHRRLGVGRKQASTTISGRRA